MPRKRYGCCRAKRMGIDLKQMECITGPCMDQDNKDGLTYGCLPFILGILGAAMMTTPLMPLGLLLIIGAICLAAKSVFGKWQKSTLTLLYKGFDSYRWEGCKRIQLNIQLT